MAEDSDTKFSLVSGGPFYRLQQRLGLLGPDLLPPVRTAFIFVALAWLPLLLLSAAQGAAWNESLGGEAFLLDYGAYARFIVAIVALVLMEGVAERHIGTIVRQFFDADLLTPEDRPRFVQALRRADRRSSSARAEAILLVLAYVAPLYPVYELLSVLPHSWLGSQIDGQIRLSPAGWWALLVSFPLMWFLMLRWLWRFVVWTILLRDLARLNLRLVATHPDQSGGLGFLGLFPSTFAPLAFVMSSVAASGALQTIMFAHTPPQALAWPFLGWLVLMIMIFVGPILVFTPLLSRFRRQALLKYGVFAGGHNRRFEEKWLHEHRHREDALGTPDISSLSDMGAVYAQVRSMRSIPAGRETFLPLFIAIGLPWFAILLTQVPLVKIMQMLVGNF